MSKYEYIESQRNDPAETNSLVKMCLWLSVSASGFYHWLKRPQSATAARRDALAARIRGWAIADHMRAELVETALRNAAATTLITPRCDLALRSRQRLYLRLIPDTC